MTLVPGIRLGQYEVLAKLGEGGMGEVYRARDTRLNRDVALKILPAAFTADPERLARFEREAQVLASLQHANIAAIYGIEDSQATRALVLELVEGPTLADRIAAGPIAVSEALAIARQIADALGAAHDAGVVHRDLKPANIKVRDDGTVKVLDFGLAKIAEATERAGGTERSSTENSPTLTARATQMGMIIGTAAYMAPEQARGKDVDRRADLWAFGVVLYEMLTGRRAFDGREVTDVLAAVIKDAPSLDTLPPDVPPAVRRLLRRTLEKDRARRLDSMAAARLELEETAEPVAAAPVTPRRMRVLMPALLVVASALIAAAVVWFARQPPAPDVLRLTITGDAATPPVVETNHNDVAITPDGRAIVYFSRTSQNQFVVRPLDRFETVVHARLGLDPRGPELSSDGRWIAFQVGLPIGTDAQLTRVAIEGGTPATICKFAGNLRGATWSADDTTILFGSTDTTSGLLRVAAAGGTPELLTKPATADGEVDHFWPHLLPGGRHALFSIMRADRSFDVALLSLESKTWRVLVKDATFARYAPTGHLVYASAGALKAAAFDLGRLEIQGSPVEVVPDVLIKSSGSADFALAANGTLVYLGGGSQTAERPFAWRDPDGRETLLKVPAAMYNDTRISPDERFAVTVVGQQASFELWLIDLTREVSSRITAPEYRAANPVWSRDGRQIAFWSPGRAGTNDAAGIFLVEATGTGQPERVTTATAGPQVPNAFTRDGKALIFSDNVADIKQVALDASRTITPVLAGPDIEIHAALSPDGRWLAYTQMENRSQVFIRPYPNVNAGRIPVSAESSWQPVWSNDGRALFFRDRNLTTLYVVDVTESGGTLSVSAPRAFTSLRDPSMAYETVAVPPIGTRVLAEARSTGPSRPPEYRVILNWFEELKRLRK